MKVCYKILTCPYLISRLTIKVKNLNAGCTSSIKIETKARWRWAKAPSFEFVRSFISWNTVKDVFKLPLSGGNKSSHWDCVIPRCSFIFVRCSLSFSISFSRHCGGNCLSNILLTTSLARLFMIVSWKISPVKDSVLQIKQEVTSIFKSKDILQYRSS